MTRQAWQRVETVLEFAFIPQSTGKDSTHRLAPGKAAEKPRAGAELGAVPQLRTSKSGYPNSRPAAALGKTILRSRKGEKSPVLGAEVRGNSWNIHSPLLALLLLFVLRPAPISSSRCASPRPGHHHLLFGRPLPRVVRPRERTSRHRL